MKTPCIDCLSDIEVGERALLVYGVMGHNFCRMVCGDCVIKEKYDEELDIQGDPPLTHGVSSQANKYTVNGQLYLVKEDIPSGAMRWALSGYLCMQCRTVSLTGSDSCICEGPVPEWTLVKLLIVEDK